MKLYFPVFIFVFLFACAPVISVGIKEKADRSIAFKEVAQSPENYEGKIVLWGGEIVQTLPQDDGRTFIEVLEWPLGWREKPRRTVSFRGKFLVLLKDASDLSQFRSGANITVAGEVQGAIPGKEIKSASDPDYQYPLILSKEAHARHSHVYPYSRAPDDRETWQYSQYEGILHY